MKCDELQQVENPIEWGLYYDKNEVDAAIDELKEKIDGQKWRGDEWARAANDKEKPQMSTELTTPIKIEIPCIGTIESSDLYLKSEVDKVIKAKDKEIAKLKEQVALLQAEFVPQPGV